MKNPDQISVEINSLAKALFRNLDLSLDELARALGAERLH